MSTSPIIDPPTTHNNPPEPTVTEKLTEKFDGLSVDVAEIAVRANKAPKEIKTDEDLVAVSQIVKDARGLAQRTEKSRKEEKEPHLQAGRDVDAYFQQFNERLKRIMDALQKRADDYQREKAAEQKRKAEEAARIQREEEARQRKIEEEQSAKGDDLKSEIANERAEQAAAAADTLSRIATGSVAAMTRVRAEGVTTSSRKFWDFEITTLEVVPLEKLRAYFKTEHVEYALRQYVAEHKNTKPLDGVRIFENIKANIR